jgi:non-specific serine/threonine protein kinase
LSGEDVKTPTPSAKTSALLDLLDDTDEKVLVFSYFEQYIRILDRVLEEKKIKHVSITGKLGQFANASAARQFQEDPECKVCIGTIGSMGEGWTLTEAGVVVFTDVFWNPSINEQCEDRTYGRVNKGLEQNTSPLIVDLYCENTVEEHVHEVVRRKEEMIDEITATHRIVDRMRMERN